MTPLVSIVVLNYKRLRELARCLEWIARQDYPNIEVIVVDNHSEEDIATVAENCGTGVRLIELPRNEGTCGGRNAGIRQATGEIIIMLDNDVRFDSESEISRVVEGFASHPQHHVLAFRICDSDTGKLRLREWCHPRHWKDFHNQEFETSFFGEGACAFRRQVFESAGLYWEPLFIGCEGYDLTLRILDRGFRILYYPRVVVRHSMSSETRSQERPYYYYTRNYIWIAYKTYGFRDGLRYLLPKLAMMLFFCLRDRCPAAYWRGLMAGFSGLFRIWPRTPVSRVGKSRLAELESTRPGLLQRLARHRRETQL